MTRRTLACCVALGIWALGWAGAGKSLSAQALPDSIVEEVEQLLSAKMAEQGIPGLSAAIAIQGEVVWADGLGTADLENLVPATALTAYRSASIGKAITATAAMQLAEEGRLDLDAPIQRYCPAFPEKRWTITPHHLLAHQSGIRHYGGPRNEEELYSAVHYDDIVTPLSIFEDDSLLFQPGTAYLYSTYGYNLLGCVIEGASGNDFMEQLRARIFEPAGMSNTRDDDPHAVVARRAGGYRRDADGRLLNARLVDMSNKLPAGGYITTAVDLVRFASAVMDGMLLRPRTFERMVTPQTTAEGEVIGYGLGWGLIPDEDWYGEKEAFHGGMTPGVSGVLYLLPGRRFAVAILANLEGVEDRVALTAEIARVVLGLGG